MNSRNTAESTGMFPPTPNPARANRQARPTNDGAAPAEMPNAPVMKRVALNEKLRMDVSECEGRQNVDLYRLPQISEPTLHVIAPKRSPMLRARLKKGAENPNSFTAGDKTRPERSGQTESAK
jgi:hypothetical protein